MGRGWAILRGMTNTVYDRALCGVVDGAGWVNPSAVVTRNGDDYLVEGFINGGFSSIVFRPSPDTVVAAIRAALAPVAVDDPHLRG